LDIINDFYLPLGIELYPCVTGLVNSILPGLDEQLEDLQKKVTEILDKMCELVGKKYLVGAVWLVRGV